MSKRLFFATSATALLLVLGSFLWASFRWEARRHHEDFAVPAPLPKTDSLPVQNLEIAGLTAAPFMLAATCVVAQGS